MNSAAAVTCASRDLRALVSALLEYADRFREINQEPADGDCARTIRRAEEWLESSGGA
jgi:hypothetical protein